MEIEAEERLNPSHV